MKNSVDLGGNYPPRSLASVDNTLLVLQNSLYPTQPHSINAKYQSLISMKDAVKYVCLERRPEGRQY